MLSTEQAQVAVTIATTITTSRMTPFTHSLGSRPWTPGDLTCLLGGWGSKVGSSRHSEGGAIPAEGCAHAGVGMKGVRGGDQVTGRGGSKPTGVQGPAPTLGPTYPQSDAQDQQEVENHHQDVQVSIGGGEVSIPGGAIPGEAHAGATTAACSGTCSAAATASVEAPEAGLQGMLGRAAGQPGSFRRPGEAQFPSSLAAVTGGAGSRPLRQNHGESGAGETSYTLPVFTISLFCSLRAWDTDSGLIKYCIQILCILSPEFFLVPSLHFARRRMPHSPHPSHGPYWTSWSQSVFTFLRFDLLW